MYQYSMRRRKFVTALAFLVPLSGCTDTRTNDNTSNTSMMETPQSTAETQNTTETPQSTASETQNTTETPQSTASDLSELEGGQEELILENIGSSAWTVVDQSSNIGGMESTNPTLTLIEGTSYVIENRVHNIHPLAFRAEDGTVLLTQDGTGELEDSEQLNWVDDGNSVELTVTEEFAERVSEYYCTVHSSMVGDVQVS
jgi:plastocyanin